MPTLRHVITRFRDQFLCHPDILSMAHKGDGLTDSFVVSIERRALHLMFKHSKSFSHEAWPTAPSNYMLQFRIYSIASCLCVSSASSDEKSQDMLSSGQLERGLKSDL